MNGRLRALDCLRGVSILLVLGAHLVGAETISNKAWSLVFWAWSHVSWLGVMLFFVLSGFLVSGLIFKECLSENGFQIKRFLIRRGLKIYPAFYVFLVTSIFVCVAAGDHPKMSQILPEAFFLQSYLPHLWQHTWSLAVEEHFYLLLSAFLFALCKTSAIGNRLLVAVSIICTNLVILALRAVTIANHPFTFDTHGAPTHLQLDSLLFGVLLSYFYWFEPGVVQKVRDKYHRLMPLAATLLMLPCIVLSRSSWVSYTVGLTMFALGTCSWLLFLINPRSDGNCIAMDSKRGLRRLLTNALATIGFYSYSIYLWHVLGAYIWRKYWTQQNSFQEFMLCTIAYLSASLVGGITMSLLIEQPVLKLRQRLVPPRDIKE